MKEFWDSFVLYQVTQQFFSIEVKALGIQMFTRDHKRAKIGEELLPLDLGYLPEFFQKKAEAELNYTASMREHSLRRLKEEVANDIKLKKLEFPDDLLLLFLNARKYNIDRTVLQIHKYLKYRKSCPYMFENIRFKALFPFLEVICLLPWRCQDGCAVILLQLGNYVAERHPIVPFKRMFLTILSQGLLDPMTQVNGYKLIADFDIDFNFLRICTPQNLYQLYSGAEKVLPGRLKEYHVINMGITGRTVWNIGQLFIAAKMKKRIHFHATVSGLLDYFPRSILPLKYGGDLEDYDCSEWLRKRTNPKDLAVLNLLTS